MAGKRARPPSGFRRRFNSHCTSTNKPVKKKAKARLAPPESVDRDVNDNNQRTPSLSRSTVTTNQQRLELLSTLRETIRNIERREESEGTFGLQARQIGRNTILHGRSSDCPFDDNKDDDIYFGNGIWSQHREPWSKPSYFPPCPLVRPIGRRKVRKLKRIRENIKGEMRAERRARREKKYRISSSTTSDIQDDAQTTVVVQISEDHVQHSSDHIKDTVDPDFIQSSNNDDQVHGNTDITQTEDTSIEQARNKQKKTMLQKIMGLFCCCRSSNTN